MCFATASAIATSPAVMTVQGEVNLQALFYMMDFPYTRTTHATAVHCEHALQCAWSCQAPGIWHLTQQDRSVECQVCLVHDKFICTAKDRHHVQAVSSASPLRWQTSTPQQCITNKDASAVHHKLHSLWQLLFAIAIANDDDDVCG